MVSSTRSDQSSTAPATLSGADHRGQDDSNVTGRTIAGTTLQHAAAQHETGDLGIINAEPRSPRSKASVRHSRHTSPDVSQSDSQQDMPARSPRLDERNGRQWRTLREAAATIKRNHAKLDPERQDVLLLRNNLDFEQEDDVYKRQYFDQSRKAFVSHAEKCFSFLNGTSLMVTPSSGHTMRLQPELVGRHDLLEADQQALQEQDDKVRNTQQELSRTEFSMQHRERRFAEAAELLVNLIDELGLVKDEDLELTLDSRVTRQPSLPSRAPSPQFHPLAETYYDLAGTVNVMRDRLIDLESEHRDALVLRNLLRDQDRLLEVSDDDFAMQYQFVHTEAKEAYEKAVQDAVDAKNRSIAFGIDPDEHLATRGGDMHASTQHNINQHFAQPPPPYASEVDLMRPFAEEGPITPPANNPLYLGQDHKSSAMLTIATGHINEESLPVSPFLDLEDARKHQQVKAWIDSHEIAGPPPDEPDLRDAQTQAEALESGDALTLAVPPPEMSPATGAADMKQDRLPP